jgi:chromosome segregation ATPase
MKSSVEEPKYSFNEVEHEGLPNGSKNSTVGYGHFAFFHALLMLTIATKVQDDIARLERAVNALQGQVSQLSDERGLLKDNYDRLKRDNQRRMWEITKLQEENRDVKRKCDQIGQEKLTHKIRNERKNAEFRAAISKLEGENRNVKEKCDQIQQENVTLKTQNERKNTEFRAAINSVRETLVEHNTSLFCLLQASVALRSHE